MICIDSIQTDKPSFYSQLTVLPPETDSKRVLSCVKMYIQRVSWRTCAFEDGRVLKTEGASESSKSSDWRVSFARAA